VGDTRDDCNNVSKELRDSLICLYPEETCEYTKTIDEAKIAGTGKSAWSFSIIAIVIAMCIVSPI